jgi:hypothetical protein
MIVARHYVLATLLSAHLAASTGTGFFSVTLSSIGYNLTLLFFSNVN